MLTWTVEKQCQHRINHIKQLMMNQAQNLDSFEVPCTKVENINIKVILVHTHFLYTYTEVIFFSLIHKMQDIF